MTLSLSVIQAVIRHVPSVIPYLSPATRDALKAAPGYEGVRNTYWAIIYDAVEQYLTGNQPITSFRNAMKKGAADAFISAAEIGYEAGGGELPMDDDTLAWLGEQQTNEFGHIDDLFMRLRAEWDGIDPIHEAFARADGYSATVDAIYAEAKMRGSDNITLEFGGDDGKESCPDCQRMKGKRHKISYILAHNLKPAPGNDAYQCKGYNCAHYWFNPKTGERFDA